MKIQIESPRYLSADGLRILKERHGGNTKFIGSWSLQDKDGNWSNQIFDIVFLENETRLVGYHFNSLLKESFKANATKSFTGVNSSINCLVENDIVYVSKYRHDFVSTPNGSFIDGGRDYTRIQSPGEGYYLKFDLSKGLFVVSNKFAHGYTICEVEYL